ncbi:S41 family peptidase [Dolichospermum sp. ST_sed1]|nr:S41 family peptidase [Dolichospermum sp. ST_sed1]
MLLKKHLILLLLFSSNLSFGENTPTQASNSSKEKYQSLEKFSRALFYIESMYVDKDKVDQNKLINDALKGIVEELDPHTMIMPKKAFEQLTSDTQGKFGGVGVIISQERGKLIVVSPIEDTPAMKAGIQAGDDIIKIDGKDLSEMKSNDAADLMRGAPGSTLTLTIMRKNEKKPLEFELKREIIKVKSVRGQMLADNFYYARITSFQADTTEELGSLLQKNGSNLKGLILDLRDNPGGLLEQAVGVSDLFVSSGLIVSTVGRDRERIEREFARKKGTYENFPIIVLVNEGSASASEIVAGALQDHERALILGMQTFGKGSVQTLVTLPDGSGLKLTIARYYTPKDRSIQAKGITPDILVENSEVKPQQKKGRKESDLAGHIESQDLSSIAKTKGILDSVKNWPSPMQNDYQLVTAFTYLKGWSIFQKPSKSTEEKG